MCTHVEHGYKFTAKKKKKKKLNFLRGGKLVINEFVNGSMSESLERGSVERELCQTMKTQNSP